MRNKLTYVIIILILLGMGYLIYSNQQLKNEIGNSRTNNSRGTRISERGTIRGQEPTMNEEIDELKDNLDEANE